MASPQTEDGYFKICNELSEAFQRLHLSGNQWRLLWVVLRSTYGWSRKQSGISLTTFQQKTGIDRRNLKRNLSDLVKRNILTRDCDKYTMVYGIQKNHSKWLLSTGGKNDTRGKIAPSTSVDIAPLTSVNIAPHKRQKTIKYSQTSNELRLSEYLFSLIKKRHEGHKKPNFQEWALHIDRMIRVDKRTPEEIEKIIEWSQGDDFWQNNILSAKKLRQQFDQLYIKAELNGVPKRRGVVL